MDELLIFEFLEKDAVAEKHNNKLVRKSLRETYDPFSLDESEFIKEYRLTKELALDLCLELKLMFKETRRRTDLSLETKVLTALSFYANGNIQKGTGCIAGHSMAQQTVSFVIGQVTNALDSPEIKSKFIEFPGNARERARTRQQFEDRFGITGVVGCISGTHVNIVRPRENRDLYYRGQKRHSLNVQIICDANMKITSLDANHGGGSKDDFIWKNHPIKEQLENLNENAWLLGDAGYPLGKCLLTPIESPLPDTPESNYNNIHENARSIVDKTINLLKARFKCLCSEKLLHYTPKVAGSIVNACVILHNICVKHNVPLPDEDLAEVLESGGPHFHQQPKDVKELNLGVMKQRSLIECLWRKQKH